MRGDCTLIRRRALEHGEGSPEYDVWLHHSLRCPECRSELYVRELLKEDGREVSGGYRLSTACVSDLVQLAENRYCGGRGRSVRRAVRLLSMGWRFAGVAVLAYVVWALSPLYFPSGSGAVEGALGLSKPVSDVASCASGVTSVATATCLNGDAEQGVFSSVGLSACLTACVNDVSLMDGIDGNGGLEPEMLSGWDIEDAIQHCRRGIDRERERLYDSIQQELSCQE